jgi:hypothetical protein
VPFPTNLPPEGKTGGTQGIAAATEEHVFQNFGLPAPKGAIRVTSVTTPQHLYGGEDIPPHLEPKGGQGRAEP